MASALDPLEAVRNFAANKLSGPWSATTAAGHLKGLIEDDVNCTQPCEGHGLAPVFRCFVNAGQAMHGSWACVG